MKLVHTAALALAAATSTAALIVAAAEPAANWPTWRGPDSTGVASKANPPTTWAEGKNVRWKIELPGRGAGSPIVWGDRVYVTTAVPAGEGGMRATQKFTTGRTS